MKKYDVGIIGSSLQAALIAGLVAREHKKKTCLVLSRAMAHKIARELNYSFDFATRPETWEMLNSGLAETLPIVTGIGGGPVVQKTNGLILCHSEAAANLLSHMYHYLHGMDYQIERLSTDDHGDAKAAYRVRSIRFVRQSILWPTVFRWLNSLGVSVVEPEQIQLKPRGKNGCQIKLASAQMDVERLVLADEQAVTVHAGMTILTRWFFRVQATSIVSLPTEVGAEQLILNPDDRFAARKVKNGSVAAIAEIPIERMGQVLAANTQKNSGYQLAARAVFEKPISKDGAPVIGKLGRTNFWGIVGLGAAGLFYAPALARLICDVPSKLEADYFLARSCGNQRQTGTISEGYGQNTQLTYGD